MADYDQSLEMALNTLNQEDNKQEGVEKVTSVSRVGISTFSVSLLC